MNAAHRCHRVGRPPSRSAGFSCGTPCRSPRLPDLVHDVWYLEYSWDQPWGYDP